VGTPHLSESSGLKKFDTSKDYYPTPVRMETQRLQKRSKRAWRPTMVCGVGRKNLSLKLRRPPREIYEESQKGGSSRPSLGSRVGGRIEEPRGRGCGRKEKKRVIRKSRERGLGKLFLESPLIIFAPQNRARLPRGEKPGTKGGGKVERG